MKNKKILLTAVAVATLSLAACNNDGDRTDYIDDNPRDSYVDDSRGDTHLNFVSDYGFENVVNERGATSYKQYRLDSDHARDDEIFHSWRHTWVEPIDYMGKDIDLYRYTGDIDGENRTIHILSHNGEAIGGYHFGRGESARDAVMLERDGFFSRMVDDFRVAWNDMFDIRG